MSAATVNFTSTPTPPTTSDLSTVSTTTLSLDASSSPSASSTTASSLPSDAPSATTSLIDDSDDYESQATDDTTNIALRRTTRKSSLTQASSTSNVSTTTSSTTAPSILRGLSLRSKAVHNTLSKGLSVALQYTKEKIGQASDVTQEEETFTQHIDYARTTAQHLKSLTITLQALIAAQQTAILAHDAFAATVKKVGNRGMVPALTTPKSGARLEAPSGGLAAIEEMTTAFTEGASSPVASVTKVDEGTEDEKTVEGKVDEDNKTSLSSYGLSIQPSAASTAFPTSTSSTTPPASTVNLIPSFYPYTRRHLSGRLIVSDSYASLLNSIQTLQAASVKVALGAISQLEIDRLHYDAYQNNLRILTTPDSASTPTAASTPHPSDPTLSDDKRRLEYEQWTLKVDSAHLTYLRSKASVEERVDELRVKVRDVLERGLSVIVAIERHEVEAARALLSDETAGKELSVRKKTNPAAMGIRRSGGQDEAEDEESEAATLSTS